MTDDSDALPLDASAGGKQPTPNEAAAGRMLSFVLRSGSVRIQSLEFADGELTLALRAKIDPASLQAFAQAVGGADAGAGSVPDDGQPGATEGPTGLAPAAEHQRPDAEEAGATPPVSARAEGVDAGGKAGDRETAVFVKRLTPGAPPEDRSGAAGAPGAGASSSATEDAQPVPAGAEAEGDGADERYGEPRGDGGWGLTDLPRAAERSAESASAPPAQDAEKPSVDEPPKKKSEPHAFAHDETTRMDKDSLPAAAGREAPAGAASDELPAPAEQGGPAESTGQPPKATEGKGGAIPRGKTGAAKTGRAAYIRYVCPRCKTAGSQPAERMGAIITCRRCGKAMRLTLKR